LTWMGSFTILPLYHRGKILWYPRSWRLDGPQNRSGRCDMQVESQWSSATPDGKSVTLISELHQLCSFVFGMVFKIKFWYVLQLSYMSQALVTFWHHHV
jgi:hypothetical protein